MSLSLIVYARYLSGWSVKDTADNLELSDDRVVYLILLGKLLLEEYKDRQLGK